MNDIVSSDLSNYGYRELDMAADLLKAYAKDGADFLTDGVTLNFNANSGSVFLADDDLNVGMLDDAGNLKQWFTCPECGNESFDCNDSEQDGVSYAFGKYEGYCSSKCLKKNK